MVSGGACSCPDPRTHTLNQVVCLKLHLTIRKNKNSIGSHSLSAADYALPCLALTHVCNVNLFHTTVQKKSHGLICLDQVQFTCGPPRGRPAGSSTAANTGGTLLFSHVVQVRPPPSWSRTFGDGSSNLHVVYMIPKLSHPVSSLPKFITDHTSPKIIQQIMPKPLPFPEAPNSFSSPSHRKIQCQRISQCLGNHFSRGDA